MDYTELGISICLGIGLAASVGFRVFLPLLILSITGHYNIISLNESWQWIGSYAAIITFSIATLIEVFAYFLPFIDNLLDTIALPLATVAGTAVIVATMTELNPVFTWALAIITGGGTAAMIKGNASAMRITSTATTGGIANPIVATVETGTSVVMSLISVFLAPLALVLTILLFYSIFKFYKKL